MICGESSDTDPNSPRSTWQVAIPTSPRREHDSAESLEDAAADRKSDGAVIVPERNPRGARSAELPAQLASRDSHQSVRPWPLPAEVHAETGRDLHAGDALPAEPHADI